MTLEEYQRAVAQGYTGPYVPSTTTPAANTTAPATNVANGADAWGLGTVGGYSGTQGVQPSNTANSQYGAPNIFNMYGYPNQATSSGGDNSTLNEPWPDAQPYIKNVMAEAQKMYGNTSGVSQEMKDAFYGMQGVANNPLNMQAQDVISTTLGTDPSKYYGIGMSNPYQGTQAAQSQTVGNPMLGINNPYLEQAINSASQDATRNMTGMFAQQNRGSGSFGNSGLAEYQARTAADTLGNIATNARMGDYTNQQNLYQNMAQMGTQNNQFNAGATNSMNQFSGQLAQQGIQNNIGQYNTAQNMLNNAAFNAPQFNSASMGNYGSLYNTAQNMNNAQWAPLQNYASAIGVGTGGSQTTQNTTTNPWLTGLGALGVGSSIYSNLFGGG